ncbi:hypothetical protein [Rhizobium ruizarguesonis]|uniref:hypothetical protein n=1 Tax=Rhizobium ruizarguesonis TaxID=2081791 RepID=UPI0012EBDD99|nr:hypothetical protein [Rhizobium ruizarguesonis]QJS27446.1 hypothetical protein RLTA1_09180 [Rhizobium leguminosarum bv. trifolii TA1]UFW96199.1 hypothetical protein RlegTA1_09145 [Rhizobium ruizarguesonis]
MTSFDPYPRDGKDVHCPWQMIALCPLYIASHEGKGFGCVDDMARPCIVARGEASYHRLVIDLISAGFVPDDAGHLEALPAAGAA